jgi:hypothetical protein
MNRLALDYDLLRADKKNLQDNAKALNLKITLGEERYSTKVAEYENSLSWRLTAPLRRASGIVYKTPKRHD